MEVEENELAQLLSVELMRLGGRQSVQGHLKQWTSARLNSMSDSLCEDEGGVSCQTVIDRLLTQFGLNKALSRLKTSI